MPEPIDGRDRDMMEVFKELKEALSDMMPDEELEVYVRGKEEVKKVLTFATMTGHSVKYEDRGDYFSLKIRIGCFSCR